MTTVRSVFSATNATIEIAGREVGHIQSLTARISYNLQPIKNLWQYNIQSFARGIQSIEVGAKRALIDVESMFGDGNAVLDLAARLDELTDWIPDTTIPYGWGQIIKQSTVDASKDIATTALQLVGSSLKTNVNAVPGVKAVQDVLTSVKNGASSISDFFSRIPFDILVKSSSVTTKSTEIEDFFAAPQVIWKFSDCRVNARALTLDIGNVIIMEDITTLARDFSEPALLNRILS